MLSPAAILIVLFNAQSCCGWTVRVPHSSVLRPQATPPRLQAPRMGTKTEAVSKALQNSGDTAVFDNVNVGVALVKGIRAAVSSSDGQFRIRAALTSLTSGVDEIVFICVYLLTINRLLKNLWRAVTWARRLQWNAEGDADSGDAYSDKQFADSFIGYLQRPFRDLGWGMLILWCVDAAYILFAALNPTELARPARGKALRPKLPHLVSIVLYANIAGRFAAAIKNWWIAHGLPKVLKPPPSAAQRAFAQRGSGIMLWSAVALLCAEGLSSATGIHLTAIFSFAGIGGIAFGLATKDLLTNVIGGALLFLTTPFVYPTQWASNPGS